MLENMRRQGASIFVYLIFCLLIAIFIINFRPGQTRQDDNGCRGVTNEVISVDGSEASQSAFHVAYSNRYNRGTGKQKVYVALEMLIRRELLAIEAESRGLLVTDDLIDDEIKQGNFYLGGQRAPIPGAIEDIDGEHFYNHKAVKGWAAELNVSLNSYREEQKRGLLAQMMATILTESVEVSRDEALAQYLFENNTVTYDVVAFKPDTYRAAMKLTDGDVDRFLASHADEVQARYKSDERTYKAVKPQLQLRQIFIAKAEPPKPADDKKADDKKADDKKADDKKVDDKKADDKKAADKKTDDKKADDKKADDKKADDKKADDKKADDKKPAVKPAGMPIDEAKAKLDAARAAISAGKLKFADAAKELATDEAAKASGGDLGWRSADNPALADKAVNDAVKALKPGEMTPVITTDRGAYLVIAEAKREGDLSFDQVKHEIAKDLARDVWAKEAAKRSALAALEHARSSTGFTLYQLYEHEAAPKQPDLDIQKLMSDPNMSDEEKQQILQMLLQRQGGQHGEIEVETTDRPAGWNADGDGAGAGSGTGSAAGSAAAAATGSAAAAGTGSGSAAAAKPAPELVASSDQLPQMAEVAKAKVNRYGPAPRATAMPGLGQSKEAAAAVFDELGPGNLAKKVYEAEGEYIVIQLVAHDQPNVATFDKNADHQIAELRQSRAQQFLDSWLKNRCEELAKDNKIHPNQELITERDDQGKILPIQYRPCMSFH